MASAEMVHTVQQIQDYIGAHIEEFGFTAEKVYLEFAYSRRNIDRMFKGLIGKTPTEYIRALRLSKSTGRLLTKEQNVLEIALDCGFGSHEGYTRAFLDAFGVTPNRYRQKHIPVPLFVAYPVRDYYTYLNSRRTDEMDNNCTTVEETDKEEVLTPFICTVTAVQRPKRKLILLRSTQAKDYLTFCEEMRCDWEGLLNSIPEKFDTAAFVELPPVLITEGTGFAAAGIEVPLDYDLTKLPDGYEAVDLEAGELLVFQTEAFEEEEDFCKAIDAALQAIEKYDLGQYGFCYDFGSAPKFNYGANPAMGAKMALPVRRK